jgi:alpha-tubulin suppressor-like RCC1 family protein
MRRALAAFVTGAVISAGLLGMAAAPAGARVVSGHALAFGANDLGQLGDGTTADRSSPVGVQSLDNAKTAAAGCGHTIGLTKGGSVVSWGDNVAGDLGDGTTVPRLAPVAIGLNAVDAVGAGCSHSLAVSATGTVFGWGANAFGQLGDGTSLDRHVPVQIPNAGPAIAVAGGSSHSLALRRDGTVQAWGDNAHGQLGNGTTLASLVPTAVQGLSGVKAVATGCDHNLALLADKTVRAWGANDRGQLGNGTTLDTPAPVLVPGLTDVVAIAAGCDFSLAQKGDGSVVAWGANDVRQLGDGTTTDRSLPVSTNVPPVKKISAGGSNAGAIAPDGTVWTWGANNRGQLGVGTVSTASDPGHLDPTIIIPIDEIILGDLYFILIRFDTTMPTVDFTTTPPTVTNETTAEFGLIGDDPDDPAIDIKFVCALDGSPLTDCAASVSFFNLLPGTHTFFVQAVDPAGNLSVLIHWTWLVDTTSPTVHITGAPPALTNQTTAQFSFFADDPDDLDPNDFRYTCGLDGGTPVDCASPTSYAGLSAGSHTFVVTAFDEAGNSGSASYTWTIDTAGPVVVIDSGPNGVTNSTSATLTFHASDPTDPPASLTIECKLDDGAFGPCSSPTSYSGLADGTHTFTVRATDPAGNTASASRTWTVDTIGPDVFIDAHPTDPSNSSSATFTFHSTDLTASLTCSIDGGPSVPCSSPANYSGLADGSHTFTVTATDGAGNSASASFTWTIDTAGPDVIIDSHPSDPSNSSSATFTFHTTDPAATFTCSIDGGAATPCLSGQTYTALGDGPHTFTVTATDLAGNSASASFTWTIDTTPPGVVIDSGPANPSNSSSATFTFHSGDPTATFTCSVDGGPVTPCVSGQSYSGLTDGSHTFTVTATDGLGNSSSASFTWTIDTVGPDVFIDSGPSNPSNSSSATFTFHSTDPAATFTCSLDGDTPVTCSSGLSYTGLADGSHTFTVTATDPAGNSASASFTWTIDTVGPDVFIDSHPSDPSNSSSATFTFHSTDPAATLTCSLDGGPATPCASPQTFAGLADGPHTFTVTATDPAGNRASASFTWTIDSVGPDVFIDSGPSNPSNSSSALFAFHSTDASATFTCSIDGGAPVPCSSPASYSGLTDGPHTFTVTATDPAGNAASASFTWTVDTTGPDVFIDSHPSDPSSTASATFTFHTTEPTATLTCSLDGAPATPCSSPQSYGGLADGPHTFTVTATDSAGNSSSASFTWTVDTAGPGVVIDSHPSDPSTSSSATFTFHSTDPTATLTCTLDGGAPAPCSSGTATYSGLTDGPHTFTVTATDGAGNSSSASFAWTIDTSAPTVVIDSGPANPTTDRSATFTFTASDANDPPNTLTTECGVDGSAFVVCASGVTFTDLAFGDHTFSVRATDPAGNTGPAATYSWTISASTDVTYEGAFEVPKGDSFIAHARLFSPSPACVNGKTITLTLDRDPATGVPGAFVFATVVTNDAGAAASSPIATATWQEGLYTVGVSFAGTMPQCASSSSTSLLRIGRSTTLVAKAIIAEVLPGVELTLGSFTGTLTEGGPDGPPIAGQVIDFFVGSDLICSAVTDAAGKATCGGLIESVEAILNLEYTAVFNGADLPGPKSFLSARANGPLLRLAGIPILPV